MSRSAFERIPLSTGEQQAYMDRKLELMRTWLENAKYGDGDSLTVKRLRGALLRAANQGLAKPLAWPQAWRSSEALATVGSTQD
jgi:hypothetical protein